MKAKKLFILCVALIFQHVATAQSVSKELATRTAIQYAKYSRCQTAPKVLMSLRGDFQREADTTITRAISFTGKALLYLVEPEDGWVLVSSELITTPILASAPTGRFPDYEDMPDGMKWLMSYYEDVIQYARDSASNNRANGMWSSYTPNLFLQRETIDSIVLSRMAQMHWNQNDNNDGYANSCIYQKIIVPLPSIYLTT